MKPWVEIGRTRTPSGGDMRLLEHDGEYVILVDGGTLMSSRMHGSEEALATLACGDDLPASGRPRVLVGGLGMGFTLRAVLDCLPPRAMVVAAELVPAVVDWNRGPLASLAGRPLDDDRVQVEVADVGRVLRTAPGRFDAILLDVDNGPGAFTSLGNEALYDDAGVAAVWTALKPGGRLAVWSACEDRGFEKRLRGQGFRARSERVRARLHKGGSRHTIFVAVKPR